MMQFILPRLESHFGWNHSDEFIFNPEEVIDYYEKRGFVFLADYNSSKLLMGEPKNEPYIPDRIHLPSGKNLDEIEILDGLDKCPIGSADRKELEGAFYYFNALTHEDMGTDRYDWADSFFDKEDEKITFEKYKTKHFY